MEPFISVAELNALQDVVDQGKATIQTYRDTPEIELRRRSVITEAFVTVETFTPVKIDLDARIEREGGVNSGRVEYVQTGRFEYDGSFHVQRDDRFQLEGVPCVVTLVHPEANIFGYRTVEFTYLGGA